MLRDALAGALHSIVIKATSPQRRANTFRHIGLAAWRIDAIVRMRIIPLGCTARKAATMASTILG
jgi:hypothetical protein